MEELGAYYNDRYRVKECSGSVSHLRRFSPEYRAVVFREYELSLLDVGLRANDLLGKSILDFGCADGIFLDYLSSLGLDKEDLYGIDISEEMVADAAQKGYQVSTLDRREEIYQQQFDLVTLWDTIEHIPEPREMLAELSSVVSPGTQLLLQTPMIGQLSESLEEAFEHYLPLEHLHLFPRETLVHLLEETGFRTIRAGSFGANAPLEYVPEPYKSAFDRLAKATDNGATQVVLAERV